MHSTLSLALLLTAFSATPAHAWDPLGHALAAKIGAKLMKDGGWSKYLQCQAPLVGAAAGFPDTVFRPQSTALAGFEAEASTHYFHIDDPKLKDSLEQLRKMSCPEALRLLSQSFPTVGSSPWRAEQFANDAHRSVRLGQYPDPAYYLGLGAHYIADHAVPWHALSDAHGEAAGHGNIHIFLEHCTDSFLNADDPLYDPSFAAGVEKLARKRRADLVKKELVGKSPSIPSLAIAGLEESQPQADKILALDDDSTFVSGKRPPAGAKKESKEAARVPGSCARFKEVLKERLATGAAFVSIFYDRALPLNSKPPKTCATVTGDELAKFKTRDYPWLLCEAP